MLGVFFKISANSVAVKLTFTVPSKSLTAVGVEPEELIVKVGDLPKPSLLEAINIFPSNVNTELSLLEELYVLSIASLPPFLIKSLEAICAPSKLDKLGSSINVKPAVRIAATAESLMERSVPLFNAS
ncbi:hypothetical protein SynMVIR181_00813 [Synechococcus sp. MVIR-18-1]|nr:hypothetical protein SynMVIR181_00813 [Synechococcus sp. MVIR-18-1]